MAIKKITYGQSSVHYHLGARFPQLKKLATGRKTILLTDENVFAAHSKKFKGWQTIVIKAGEAYKVQATVDHIVEKMIESGADRSSLLVGVGGGVITDLAGYVASVYMRGIQVGFVPTSLLAMVDAAIGGKNGIDVGVYKNMVGTIRQPSFLLYDISLLETLPDKEWRNGFAEIIKHATIKSPALFRELESNSVAGYRKKRTLLESLVTRNMLIKSKLVQLDEFEKGDRRLLNFGHTLGHAMENQYDLSHGEAIAIGMVYAARFSQELLGFKNADAVKNLLEKYGLPSDIFFDREKIMQVLKKDKKKNLDQVHYVLLEKIGKAVTRPLSFSQIEELLK
ncbi:MAG: 3-dehydroquinate synthase [Flavisolibacter sp.]